MGGRTEISIAPSPSASIATLKAEACRSQAMYLFVSCSNFLVELADLCVFWRIVAAQLVEHFADGKLIYFSHRHLLCAALAGSALLPRAWARPPVATVHVLGRQVAFFTIRNPLVSNSRITTLARCAHSSGLIQWGLLQSGSSSLDN